MTARARGGARARSPDRDLSRKARAAPPGAEPHYKYGVAHLYAETGRACLPIALNSGLFWPRRSLRRYPGTIVVEVLDPIPPGLDKEAFFARLQQRHRDRDRAARRRGRARARRNGIEPRCR